MKLQLGGIHCALIAYLCYLAAITRGTEFLFQSSGIDGRLQTPNFPGKYPLNITCRWTISTESKYRILINFTDFLVEPNKKCLYDYVQIKENGHATPKFCGSVIPPNYLSRSQKVEVIFRSDKSHPYKGFKAVWQAIQTTGILSTSVTSLPCPSSTLTVTKTLCSFAATAIHKCLCRTASHKTPAYTSSSPSTKSIITIPNSLSLVQNCSSIGNSKRTGTINTKSNSLAITFGCLALVFLIVDIILVVILCRKVKKTCSYNGRSRSKQRPTNFPNEGFIPYTRPLVLRMVDGDLIVTDGSGEIAEQSSPKYFTMHTNGQTCVEPRKPSIQRTNNMNQPNIVAESIVIHTGTSVSRRPNSYQNIDDEFI